MFQTIVEILLVFLILVMCVVVVWAVLWLLSYFGITAPHGYTTVLLTLM